FGDDKPGPAGARLHLGFLVRAELPEEDGQVAFLGPFGSLCEGLADPGLLSFTPGPFAAFPSVGVLYERRALVRELERIIKVDGEDKVSVIRELEPVERPNRVPLRGSDNHRASQIGFANSRE